MSISQFAQAVGKDIKELKLADAALVGRVEALENKPTQTIDTVALKQEIKADIIGGAPSEYDTLKEMSDYIAQDGNAGVAMAVALGNRLRVDEAQALDETQKQTARTNIGLGDDYLAVYNQAKASA